MRQHDVLGITISATPEGVESAYGKAIAYLDKVKPENEYEKSLLEDKRKQIDNARIKCLESSNDSISELLASSVQDGTYNTLRMYSCITCVPPGLGWLGSKGVDCFCNNCTCGCCANGPYDCYHYDEASGLPDEGTNFCRICDLLGWIACLLITIPLIKDWRERRKKEAQRRYALEAEKERKKQAEIQARLIAEEQKTRAEEQKIKNEEKKRVELILEKLSKRLNVLSCRKKQVIPTLQIIKELSDDTEIEKILSEYKKVLKQESDYIEKAMKEIRVKKSFQYNYQEFTKRYKELIDFVDREKL